ncbi:hypothetical protein U8P73_36275 (plasmid) [Rhizobium beringeri]|uniref:hypothetical protein n=1 Tax=Rhizobium beringeri TaxID=3019934 RepID=UPI002DDD80FF|nr:hypothetical protein [Rhizobium beringeri]WSG93608.1 hypothetical protein U8P73_36275 [Rhizobium beringeri]
MIQTSELRLSVHVDAAMDDDLFHIRLVTKDEKIQNFCAAIVRLHGLAGGDCIAFGTYKVRGFAFEVTEGEVHNEGRMGIRQRSGAGLLLLDDLYLDFNISKQRFSDDRLDGTRKCRASCR